MNCSCCTKPLVNDAVFCPHCKEPVAGAIEYTDYQYEAFISYRHLPLDRTAAMKIQRAIEGFRIPKQLVDDAGKQRLGKCFRDEDELPTSSSLSEQIENALKHSRFLIVVCSKHTRESLWVQREVELFSSYHGRDRVLIALAEGEPDESFPELLLTLTRKNADGQLQEVAAEPLAADVRDLKRSKFEIEKLRLIAPILGCNFDDLRQRAKMRRNRTIAAIASGVAVVSLAFGSVSTYQQIQIQENYRQIQIQQSEYLARESTDLLAQDDRYQAIQVALAALPKSAASTDRPYVPDAQMALEQALGIYSTPSNWGNCYSDVDIEHLSEKVAAFDTSGLEASFSGSKSIEVRETATGNLVTEIDAVESLGIDSSMSISLAGLQIFNDKVIVVFEGSIGCFDAHDGTLIWGMPIEGIRYSDSALAISPDGQMVAIAVAQNFGIDGFSTLVLDTGTGETIHEVKLPSYTELGLDSASATGSPNLEFFPDGSRLAVAFWGSLFDINLADESYNTHKLQFTDVHTVDFVDGLISVVTVTDHDSQLRRDVCLEVFDSNLAAQWNRTETVDIAYGLGGDTYAHSFGVFGAWNYFEGNDKQLVAVLGPKLLLLDEKTGEQVFEITSSTTFLDCIIASGRHDDRLRIFAMMGDGTVICRRPFGSNNGKGGLAGDTKLDVGYASYAQFAEADGRVYLSTVTNHPCKRTVYRFSSPEDLSESRLLDMGTNDAIKKLVFNKSLVFAETDSELVLADPDSLEATAVVPKKALESLDWEQEYSMETTLSSDGNLYVLGPKKKDTDEFTSQTIVYQVSKDGAVELLFDLGSAYIDEFTVVPGDSGDVLLLVGRLGGTDRVALLDPRNPNDPVRTDIAVPDVCYAWHGNGRIIACHEDSSSANPRFALYDTSTGEEIDCDLNKYPMQSRQSFETDCSMSADNMTFALACSDGLVRVFDITTGSMLWEKSLVPSTVQILLISGNGNLFVQDAFGQCLLVSGKTGDVIDASSSTLEPIRLAAFRPSDNTVLAAFAGLGVYPVNGFALVSLDENSFGPQSILYNCAFISPDAQLVAFRDDLTDDFYTARRLSLDELIAAGHDLAANHELTESERQLYQVGE